MRFREGAMGTGCCRKILMYVQRPSIVPISCAFIESLCRDIFLSKDHSWRHPGKVSDLRARSQVSLRRVHEDRIRRHPDTEFSLILEQQKGRQNDRKESKGEVMLIANAMDHEMGSRRRYGGPEPPG
jgi:hypothetical protein